MKLVYDVETTGLLDFKKPANDPSQPRIIQIAAIVIDDNRIETARLDVFIKPDGWVMPPDLEKLTGITQAILEEHGIPIADALTAFLDLWRACNERIAHNDSFDGRMLRSEMARLYGNVALLEEWKQAPAFCTMLKSSPICNLPPTEKMVACGFNKPKPPKLEEAYAHFHGSKPQKSHDAMADTESTLAIYLKLMEGKTS